MIKRIFRQLRTNVLTGFLLLMPLGATIFVVKWLLSFIDNLIFKDLPDGVGILVVLTIAFFTGLLAKNYFGRIIIEMGNSILSSIPLMNKIYLTIQQIIDSVTGDKKKLFEQAVLIEYPKKDSYCIGFQTADTKGEIQEKIGEQVVSVFVPTTPNPTSGFLLYLPKSQIIKLNMNVETAIKTVMSAGIVNPDHFRKTNHMYVIPPGLKNFNWMRGIHKKSNGSKSDQRD